MVNLYFLSIDPKPTSTKKQDIPKPQKPQRAPKKPTWMATEQVDMPRLQELIKELEDRILVVAFEEAEAEGSRKAYWKRWERIARAMPNKKQFKRHDEEDLPMVVRFDCSGDLGEACKQIVGTNLPAALMWKGAVPRLFPSDEVRTDTQVFNYLANQMQEAVKYQETVDDAEYFTTDDGIQLMYFGKDENGIYGQVADMMRDDFNFGRTNNAEIAEAFEAEIPSLRMYRNFDESPLMFTGNLTDSAQIKDFILQNSVPLFGEWNQKMSKMYQKRKLPIVFIAVDPTEDETEAVLETSVKLAEEFKGTFSFTQVDAIMNADLANRIGANELPMVLILAATEMRKRIDFDNIELSIRGAISEWQEAAARGPEDAEDLDDEYEDDYDEEYDEEGDEYEEDLDDYETEETAEAVDEEEKEEL
eukprot:TRINITY_DN38_c0_g1_i1.p1 TRINITY_DN38_c0_g1~~TRINITY_DN38_c0_g1_i1.p1  ORF type:complete len:418 (-),score=108.73 TRINITY_DN38_c0_g1_i1:113-1366(-)